MMSEMQTIVETADYIREKIVNILEERHGRET